MRRKKIRIQEDFSSSRLILQSSSFSFPSSIILSFVFFRFLVSSTFLLLSLVLQGNSSLKLYTSWLYIFLSNTTLDPCKDFLQSQKNEWSARLSCLLTLFRVSFLRNHWIWYLNICMYSCRFVKHSRPIVLSVSLEVFLGKGQVTKRVMRGINKRLNISSLHASFFSGSLLKLTLHETGEADNEVVIMLLLWLMAIGLFFWSNIIPFCHLDLFFFWILTETTSITRLTDSWHETRSMIVAEAGKSEKNGKKLRRRSDSGYSEFHPYYVWVREARKYRTDKKCQETRGEFLKEEVQNIFSEQSEPLIENMLEEDVSEATSACLLKSITECFLSLSLLQPHTDCLFEMRWRRRCGWKKNYQSQPDGKILTNRDLAVDEHHTDCFFQRSKKLLPFKSWMWSIYQRHWKCTTDLNILV